jgi:hypothetical protein
MHFARWYSEIEEYTKISLKEKILRDELVGMMKDYTVNMENYSYYGSNPGIPEDSYEDIADYIIVKFNLTRKEDV